MDFLRAYSSSPPDLICISKTWLKQDLIINLSIPGYEFRHIPSESRAGGVAIFVSNKFQFETTNKYNINSTEYEDIWIKLHNSQNQAKYLIGVAYRHPTSNTENFITKLNDCITKIIKRKQIFYLLGHFNINIDPKASSYKSNNLVTV